MVLPVVVQEDYHSQLKQNQHTKSRLRRQLLSRRATLTQTERQQKSAVIASHIVGMPVFLSSHTIMVYLALPQEVQTVSIIQAARRQGKRIVVPVVEDDRLMAVELSQPTARLRRGAFGILEPEPPAAVVRPEEIQYVAVPGVAFDRRGVRLGFGKGFYDRFLVQLPATTYRCGLAFCIQMVPCVPWLPHDIRMHGVVTEQGLIPCNEDSAC